MKAVIPIAGSGTRLRPLTHSKPKALLHVGTKPIIAHIVESLLSLGCKKLVLIVSHESINISEYLKKKYHNISVESVLQEERLGLGHAVSLTRQFVSGEEMIILYGDTIIDGNLTGLLDNSADAVITVKEVDDPRRFGVVNVENGYIRKFIEKPENPQSNLAIVGLNYFKSSDALFDCIEEIIAGNVMTKGEYQITDAFQLMLEHGGLFKSYPVDGWFDCGTPASLLATNRYILEKEQVSATVPGTIVIPPVFIPTSAIIKHSIIGPYVSVGENAVIEKSIITDSIIGSGTKVSNASFNGSLIGDNALVNEIPRILTIGDNSSLDFDNTIK
ncbi:sugar phosphate nucleotidyltransferase [Candidatus Omnitrophota bacterium]